MGKYGLFVVVFIVLLTIKITGAAPISWWIVTSPLWGVIVALLAVVVIVAVVLAIIALIESAIEAWEARKNGVR